MLAWRRRRSELRFRVCVLNCVCLQVGLQVSLIHLLKGRFVGLCVGRWWTGLEAEFRACVFHLVCFAKPFNMALLLVFALK